MAKLKVTDFRSRKYTVHINRKEDGIMQWSVMDAETMAETNMSQDFDHYRALKRTWRRSKEDFDSLCRFMDYKDLFSTAGIRL